MQIQENVSLKLYNTFGIDVTARYFATFENVTELEEILNSKLQTSNSKLILGGGSNILFTKNYNGIVLKNEIKGIETVQEDDEFIYIKAGAGENWHQFVLHCVQNNYAGVEKLLSKGIEVTDMNAAIFDAKNSFKGCIAGIHEVLRQQGLLESIWCLNADEKLSQGQIEEINRVCKSYPHLTDDDFVKEFLSDLKF